MIKKIIKVDSKIDRIVDDMNEGTTSTSLKVYFCNIKLYERASYESLYVNDIKDNHKGIGFKAKKQ
jgi:hypothetical protein